MAWLLINNRTGLVEGIGPTPPPEGHVRGPQFTVKEWMGPVSIGDPDPTVGQEDALQDITQAHQHFDNLAELATAEIAWLQDALDEIDTATPAEMRAIVKRLLQENLHQIRAWRYLLMRQGGDGCDGC